MGRAAESRVSVSAAYTCLNRFDCHHPSGRYVALGAFDEGRDNDGPDVPIAFIIAEVTRLDETKV